MEEIDIYTDGGCRGNPGLGAYAAIMYRNNQPWFKYGDCYDQTTNNEMESSALLIALHWINAMHEAGNVFKYTIYSDSTYVVNTYNDWIDGWISSNRIKWKPNKDIWEQVYTLKRRIQNHGINLAVVKVKGHADIPRNVEVDKLVNKLMDDKKHTDLLVKHPNLAYLEKSQLRNYSDVESEELPKDVSTPSTVDIIPVSDIHTENESVIVEVPGKNIIIPKTQLINLINELGLEQKL